ncbi:EF_hand domain-containing protein [Hexamita inflata]|uniref:EF_hand domain-containing protein n=1 Tax=Hexamita inflata TaxID=28002 RepID=A0ABP1HYU2_9EUKA
MGCGAPSDPSQLQADNTAQDTPKHDEKPVEQKPAKKSKEVVPAGNPLNSMPQIDETRKPDPVPPPITTEPVKKANVKISYDTAPAPVPEPKKPAEPEKPKVYMGRTLFDKPDVDQCKAAFKQIDLDGSGKLDQEEVTKAMRKMNPKMSKEDIIQLFQQVDGGEGELNVEQFIHFVYVCQNANVSENEKIVFLITDMDCSGTIDADETFLLFKKLGLEVNEEEAKELVKSMADNGDGTLSYDQFKQLLDQISG